ncbi:MAG: trigger factor [Rickettsiales bacterium TMED289]|nr:MAG: trigger factor [Rickettsiales bacterium TMED289]
MNLKIKSKKINDFTYELAINVKWVEIKEDFNSAKKKVAKEIKLPGFRKGKVPENILMSQYLNSVEMGFVQEFCEKYYLMALQKEKLTPINQAQLKDIDFSYEKDLSFKSQFEIEPLISLPKFKKNMVSVERINFLSNDEEVDKTIKNIMNSQAKAEQIEKNSKDGDFLIVDMQELDSSGIPIIGKKEKKYIAIGQDPFVEDKAESFKSKNVGDSIKIMIDMGNGEKNYEFTIDTIQRRVPPKLDDEFVKQMDPHCNSVSEWKENVKKSIDNEYQRKSDEMFNSSLIDAFVKLVNPVLPLSMLDNYLNNIINEVKQNQNNTEMDDNKIKEQYQLFAENNLKWFLLRKTIISNQELSISKDEINNFIKEALHKNESQKAEIERFYKKESNKNKLADDLLDQKILEMLKDFSKIKEKDQKTSELEGTSNQ